MSLLPFEQRSTNRTTVSCLISQWVLCCGLEDDHSGGRPLKIMTEVAEYMAQRLEDVNEMTFCRSSRLVAWKFSADISCLIVHFLFLHSPPISFDFLGIVNVSLRTFHYIGPYTIICYIHVHVHFLTRTYVSVVYLHTCMLLVCQTRLSSVVSLSSTVRNIRGVLCDLNFGVHVIWCGRSHWLVVT